MKIGVTGGTGFIGQSLLREYAKDNEFVVIARNNKEELFESDNVKYIFCDYTKDNIIKTFSGCDAIIHLGAARSNEQMEEHFLNYELNIKFAQDLFEACHELGIDNVINISSTAVYSETLPIPFKEDMSEMPLSFYGVCKIAIEKMAHIFNKKYNMKIKTLRIAQLIGVGEHKGLVKMYLDRCLEGNVLNVYGTGSGAKEYVFVNDVIDAIMMTVSKTELDGVYNIGTGVLTSNAQLAADFCEVFDNEAGYVLLTDKPEILSKHVMDVSKAEAELGFRAKYSLKDALCKVREVCK